MKERPLPLVLLVLDGWGHCPERSGNAIVNCDPRHILALQETYPSTLLQAAGEAVGLPDGYIGNSEVGHSCLGAGRTVLQDLTRIQNAIADGSFCANPALTAAMEMARRKGSTLHLMGLVSDGGVHSHIEHLRALVKLAGKKGLERLVVHAFLDGRDTPPRSGLGYIQRLESFLGRDGPGRIGSLCGRYFAMDRDRRWDRTARAFQVLVHGGGNCHASGVEAVEAAYARGETDEFVSPIVVAPPGAQPATIRDGDVVIYFNFRADRARQLTRALTETDFSEFDTGRRPKLALFTCMAVYDATLELPAAFESLPPEHVLGEILSAADLRQVRAAETEKYAHVTYFFNGGREKAFRGEERLLIPSPKVPTYDLKPEMSAREITRALVKALDRDPRRVVLVNYANADMVGHTGRYEAALSACHTVDECVGTLARAIQRLGGTLIVTADHGNAEQMWQVDGRTPHTAHTTNPVPFILVGERFRGARLQRQGLLSDIAPTLLSLLGIAPPPNMTGKSLLVTDRAI
ncbi:MAG: 2,3-bisphosphoglycerate-independent phosphoglycerate mutase [Acidobacteriota bacterium]